ncbi:MAG TPA: phage-shock protein [Desulfobacterales bacterium]|nr:phage-shock protein [Desulfobacterales bacterium]
MNAVFIVALIAGASVIGLAIIGGTILIAIKIFKGGLTRGGQKQQADEARIIQEIYQGLARMEDRVEALETILLDPEKKDQNDEQV